VKYRLDKGIIRSSRMGTYVPMFKQNAENFICYPTNGKINLRILSGMT